MIIPTALSFASPAQATQGNRMKLHWFKGWVHAEDFQGVIAMVANLGSLAFDPQFAGFFTLEHHQRHLPFMQSPWPLGSRRLTSDLRAVIVK